MMQSIMKFPRVIKVFGVLTLCISTTIGALAKAESPSKTPIKNILFIISDDLKASTVGSYGSKVCKTPHIDQLAKEGMLFTRAYAQGALCAPSRPSMMFSRYTRARIQPEVHKSFPQVLKEKGWYSARVGKIFHMGVSGDIERGTNGIDYPLSWTERFNCSGLEALTPGLYEGLNLNVEQTSMDNRQNAGTKHRMYVSVKMDGDGSDQPDYKAADKAIDLLQKHQDKPFVLALGFVRPHYPMVAPKKYFKPYKWKKMKMPERRENDWDDIPQEGIPRSTSQSSGLDKYPDNQKKMLTSYYASVTFMDDQLGRVMEELDRLGLRESTAVVFTSDHGYHLGEHDFWLKSNLHEESQRVPLIISAPGVKPGVSNSLVELVDIFPTVMDLLGVETPAQCDGLSLAPILANPKAEIRNYAFSYHGSSSIKPTNYALRGKDWAYMNYGEGKEELYDMQRDPNQFDNLASNEQYKRVLRDFRRALEERHTFMQSKIH